MKFSDYEENEQRGSGSFPIQYYYVDEKHPRYVMRLHWHREFELVRVIKGELALYLNNEKHIATAGDVVFIASGTLHRAEPTDCIYECVVFDLSIVSGYSNTKISSMIHPIISGDVETDITCDSAAPIARELIRSVAEAGAYFELKVSSLAAEMIYEMYSSGAVRAPHDENKRLTHRRALMTLLLDTIEREYSRKITLSELSEIAQINEKYLCRFFKEFTGQTPIDYINRLRVDRACYEMTVNKLNVTETAYECGFNELSYFSKCFKKYKGVSPGQYRSEFCSENGEIKNAN